MADAVLGPIDTKDAHGLGSSDRLLKLMNSDFVQRLRRIRQLLFVPQSYVTADHSRFAHSIGTMHTMRSLIAQLEQYGFPEPELLKALQNLYPDTFRNNPDDVAILKQHLLTAALLLDVGELPYSQATRHVFSVATSIEDDVRSRQFLNTATLGSKQLLTIGILNHDTFDVLLQGYSVPLLEYLTTGAMDSQIASCPEVWKLRQMTDGQLDADRLDYVYRDSYHTIGDIGNPFSVIKSIIAYDQEGVIVNSPGPASMFLATRAHLYSNVYLAPASRFRTVLLVKILLAIQGNVELSSNFLGEYSRFDLTLEHFLQLDDELLDAAIRRIFNAKSEKGLLSRKDQEAINQFANPILPYDYFWLPPQNGKVPANAINTLPNAMFFDTLRDQSRIIYRKNSIKVRSSADKYLKSELYLENCVGPFQSLFSEEGEVIPRQRSIQLFIPSNISKQQRTVIEKAIENQWLGTALNLMDPLMGSIVGDTRGLPEFTGRSIFISYQGDDTADLLPILRALYRRKRKYFCMIEPFQGVGGSPYNNSVEAAMAAEAFLILVSKSYVKRMKDLPNGPLDAEFNVMANRTWQGQVPAVFLTFDNRSDVKDEVDWKRFREDHGDPFLAQSLRGATNTMINLALDKVIQKIDEF